ncbi:MAG: SLOG family protein [Rikenellaceae bacterium]
MNISFTGHRDFDAERFMELLRSHIVRFSQCGSVTFWSGMAVGFDLAAAECVLELRDEGYDLKLCCVVPYVGQSQFFNRVDLERYDLVLRRADRVVTLAADYTPDIFYLTISPQTEPPYRIKRSQLVLFRTSCFTLT